MEELGRGHGRGGTSSPGRDAHERGEQGRGGRRPVDGQRLGEVEGHDRRCAGRGGARPGSAPSAPSGCARSRSGWPPGCTRSSGRRRSSPRRPRPRSARSPCRESLAPGPRSHPSGAACRRGPCPRGSGLHSAPMSDRGLTHLDPLGRARMVDVTPKEVTHRRAIARGRVYMKPETSTARGPGGDQQGRRARRRPGRRHPGRQAGARPHPAVPPAAGGLGVRELPHRGPLHRGRGPGRDRRPHGRRDGGAHRRHRRRA